MKHSSTCRILLASVLLAGALNSHAQSCTSTNSLTTLYAETNGLDGVMFDVVAAQTITVNCFDVNWSVGTTSVAMWYKSGTHVGSEQDPGDWTSIGSVPSVVSAGPDLPTSIPLDVDVTVPAGSTYAFYISCNLDSDPTVKYTDGTLLGAVLASDANIQVLEGSGVSFQFGASVFSPRQFNGTVYYSAGGVGINEQVATGPVAFPNPTSDRLTLDLSAQSGLHQLRMLDVSGRLVRAEQVNGGARTDLDLSQLRAGTYSLQLLSATGVQTVRVVKQ